MNVVTSRLAREDGVLVSVTATEGSAPREPGAWMLVFPDDVIGTIGGGHVEFEAIARARVELSGSAQGGPSRPPSQARYALGPSLGQCCGGVMHLSFERVGAADVSILQARLQFPLAPLALFGGGHVGRALVNVLATLPFRVSWIDSRDEIFPADVPGNVECEHSEPVQAAVAQLATGSRVLVMSFSHAEDLDIVAACLKRLRERDDLPYIGLIGSKSKWAVFRHRLEQRGYSEAEIARITCPIGLPGIRGKQPEVIAVSVAAQLLQNTNFNP